MAHRIDLGQRPCGDLPAKFENKDLLESSVQTPYELLGGEAGVRRLADTFYDVMNELPEAASIRAMHGQELAPIKQKLFEYLSGWLGGPPLYRDKYNTICLFGAHKPFSIGPAQRDQWLRCMDEALRRVDASPEVIAMLKEPMFRIADVMRNADQPA
jgi:hemoglobin